MPEIKDFNSSTFIEIAMKLGREEVFQQMRNMTARGELYQDGIDWENVEDFIQSAIIRINTRGNG